MFGMVEFEEVTTWIGRRVRLVQVASCETLLQRSALNLAEYINVFRYLKRTAHVKRHTASAAVQLNNKELRG
jgi:hypothetical protein